MFWRYFPVAGAICYDGCKVKAQAEYQLLNNTRFYILAFSLILSVAVFTWLRLSIASDQLLYIRVQQVYGLICLIFWYVALIISPLGYVIGKQRMKHVDFSRRAIGVSAFYFALLHAGVALYGQLGGVSQIQYLPDLFKWSLLGGLVALVVLAVMAATSFDAVIQFMTFRRWKWLHRLVYLAGVVVILHIWSIGTHLAYGWAQWGGFVMLALLSGLEVLRSVRLANKKLQLSRSEAVVTSVTIWAVVLALLLTIPFFVQNYHSRHTGHDHSQETK